MHSRIKPACSVDLDLDQIVVWADVLRNFPEGQSLNFYFLRSQVILLYHNSIVGLPKSAAMGNGMTAKGTTDVTGAVNEARPVASELGDPLLSTARDLVPAPSTDRLPTPLSRAKPAPKRRWRLQLTLALALFAAGGGGAYYWWQQLHPPLPPTIVFGNGRLDSDEVNIDTKYAARILQILADGGDLVKAGQVVARMDTRDLQASLKRAEATVRQATHAVDEANANVVQQKTQALLAKQEYDRAAYLVKQSFETKEVLDQREQQLNSANAALDAANERVIESQHALDAATHDVELYTVEINDDTLVAPYDGRIQYRVANVGEVLPAGGHVFAMLDTSYVYIDIYLTTQDAGRVKYGADARIVVDAYPKEAIPAKVIFVATQAQFTPKTVETQTEREKLMFRIRVRIDADWLRARTDAVTSGLPGVAYVLTDPSAKWPDWLQGTAKPSGAQ
jgi:HlyD family secretion protein